MIRIRQVPLLALFVLVAGMSLSGAEKPISVALIPDGLSQSERMPLQNYLSEQMD
jgi:hypothetical protein